MHVAFFSAAAWIGMVAPALVAGQEREKPPTGFSVALQSGEVRVGPGRSARLDRRLEVQEEEPVPALVVFGEPLDHVAHDRLGAAGVRLVDFLGGTAYLVLLERRRALDADGVAALVAGADVLEPRGKLQAELAAAGTVDELQAETVEDGRIRLLVQLYPGATDADARRALGPLATPRRYAEDLWRLAVPFEDRLRLAEQETVRFVGLDTTAEHEDLNDRGRAIVRSELVQRVKKYDVIPVYLGLTGKGVSVAVCDGGISRSHADFFDLLPDGMPAESSRIYGPEQGSNDHGTEVASVIGGSGVASAGWKARPAFSLRGHAPRARLGSFPKLHGPDSGYESVEAGYHAVLAGDDPSDLTNHSYVLDAGNAYSGDSRVVDRVIRGDGIHMDSDQAPLPIPARPAVWGMGNNGASTKEGSGSGYHSALNQSKNAIVVGATSGYRSAWLWDESSLGPTRDGRLRPDVVAPGTQVVLADDSPDEYTANTGTSMACAVVSGVLALAMEGYAKEYGQSTASLPPSLFRALLVATAHDLEKTRESPDWTFVNPDTGAQTLYHAGPDLATGFGLVDAEAACAVLPDENRWRVGKLWHAGHGQEFCLEVPPGIAELRVALAWDDLAASLLPPPGAPKLVNDLDLMLLHEDELGNTTVHHPWRLEPLPAAGATIQAGDVLPAGRGADHLNNLEVVAVPEPAEGTWRVRVEAHALPFGVPQAYSIVSSQPLDELCPLLPVDLPLLSFPEEWGPEPWTFERRGDRLLLSARAVHPLDHLQYLLPGPPALAAGPGEVTLRLVGLPCEATPVVFDARGVRARGGPCADGREVRELQVPVNDPTERLYLAFEPPAGEELPTDEHGRLALGLALLRRAPDPVAARVREAPFDEGAASQPRARGAGSEGRTYRVELDQRVREVDAEEDAAAELKGLVAGEGPVHVLVLLEFEPTAAERVALEEAGVRLIEFLGGAAYVARVRRTGKALPSLRWVGELEPEDKLDPAVRSAAGAPLDLVVVFHADVPAYERNRVLAGQGSLPAGLDRWRVRAQPGQVLELAREDAVRRIELDGGEQVAGARAR